MTPRRRDLSIRGGIFPIRPVSGTEKFGDTRRVIFPPNPHPYSGLSLRGAACHAFQATDRRPELRSEVVRSCGGASRVPILSFSSFWKVPAPRRKPKAKPGQARPSQAKPGQAKPSQSGHSSIRPGRTLTTSAFGLLRVDAIPSRRSKPDLEPYGPQSGPKPCFGKVWFWPSPAWPGSLAESWPGRIGPCQEAMPSRPSCFVLGKRPWVPGYGCLRRFFTGKNSNPQILDMPAWRNLGVF